MQLFFLEHAGSKFSLHKVITMIILKAQQTPLSRNLTSTVDKALVIGLNVHPQVMPFLFHRPVLTGNAHQQ